MSKKTFDAQSATRKFFDTTAKETQSKEPGAEDLTPEHIAQIVKQSMDILDSVTPKRGRPKKEENEKLRGYRYNLNLDRDLQQYLKEAAWKKRTSITQYINDLIRADMEAYFKDCVAKGIDPKEGWETDED